MGKNVWIGDDDDERLQRSHQGCMWGVIHALNYHHWNYNNVKKMVISQCPDRTKRGKGSGRHKKRTTVNDVDDLENLLDVDPWRFFADENTASAKTCSTNRKSLRARIKALISDEISKEERGRQKGSVSLTKSKMRRTYSIHYLDPSVLGPRGQGNADSDNLQDHGTNDDVNISGHKLLSENHTLGSDKFEEDKESQENKRVVKGNEHVRDKYKCKEHADILELFRVNQDVFQEYLQSTDDGIEDCLHNLQTSNKLARLTKSGSFPAALRPSKLKHKQEETWPCLREEKLVSFKFLKDHSSKSGPITLGRSSSSCNDIDASAFDLSKTMSKHRRALSLTESMERYTQLLETSYSREPNLHHSKSLRLAKEHENLSGGHAPMSFRRVRSLSQADSNWTLQNGLYSDAYVSGVSNTTVLHDITENYVSPNAEEELGEEMDGQRIEESDSEEHFSLEDVAMDNAVQTSQGFLNQMCSEEDIINQTDYPTSEELDHIDANELSSESQNMEHRCTDFDANEVSNDSQICFSLDIEDLEIGHHSAKIHGQSELYTDETDWFNFVTEILEQSGFKGNAFLEPWHSLDQPLNPLLFEEVDASWPHEEESQFDGEKDHVNCHHQLLFDLINEVLVQIYDGSFTYYPKALSSNCHLRPLPSGDHFVDEVWARISKITSLRPQVDESVVTYGFPKDLGKDDGWMNLQFESECVALELEDWIFDDLLEEVLCS